MSPAAKKKPTVTVALDTPGLEGEDWPKRTNDRFPAWVLLGQPAPEGYVPGADGTVPVPADFQASKPAAPVATAPKPKAPGKPRVPGPMSARWKPKA